MLFDARMARTWDQNISVKRWTILSVLVVRCHAQSIVQVSDGLCSEQSLWSVCSSENERILPRIRFITRNMEPGRCQSVVVALFCLFVCFAEWNWQMRPKNPKKNMGVSAKQFSKIVWYSE